MKKEYTNKPTLLVDTSTMGTKKEYKTPKVKYLDKVIRRKANENNV